MFYQMTKTLPTVIGGAVLIKATSLLLDEKKSRKRRKRKSLKKLSKVI